MGFPEFFGQYNTLVITLIVLWTLPWKGVALWKAARLYHTKWFVALLILNTIAILDIFYIFVITKKAEQSEQKQN